MRARHAGAPVEGYSRFYRLVDADEDDYLEAVTRKLNARGYDVLDVDWWQRPANMAGQVFVAVWAKKVA